MPAAESKRTAAPSAAVSEAAVQMGAAELVGMM
jgi:hypothetical protein